MEVAREHNSKQQEQHTQKLPEPRALNGQDFADIVPEDKNREDAADEAEGLCDQQSAGPQRSAERSGGKNEEQQHSGKADQTHVKSRRVFLNGFCIHIHALFRAWPTGHMLRRPAEDGVLSICDKIIP